MGIPLFPQRNLYLHGKIGKTNPDLEVLQVFVVKRHFSESAAAGNSLEQRLTAQLLHCMAPRQKSLAAAVKIFSCTESVQLKKVNKYKYGDISKLGDTKNKLG